MAAFRLLQFNMQFGQIWDDADPDRAPVRPEFALEAIRSQDADIILLQEVEHALPGGAQQEPPPNYTFLKKGLHEYDSHFSYPRMDPRELPFGIGLAIFCRHPLRNPCTRHLPSPPVEFYFEGETRTPTDRILIGAQATIHGRDLQIFNTHLLAFFMLNSSSEVHTHQRQLVARVLSESKLPTLLGGDFNVHKHQSLVEQFASCGFNTVQDLQPTWRRQPYVLDHVFYNAGLKPAAHRVQPTIASDHHMLVVDFDFS